MPCCAWFGPRRGGPMRLSHEPLALATRHEFRIAHGSSRTHDNTLVTLEHDRVTGQGEAAPSHYYGQNRAIVEAALDAWAPHLGDDPFDLDGIDARLASVLAGNRAAHAALDAALHDWIGRSLGQPVWRMLGLDRGRVPLSAVTLGMASPEEMEQKLDEVAEFPIIKVKLGGPGDVENLRRVRGRFRGAIYVDGNEAWTPSDAVRVLRSIEPLDIALV